MKKVLSFLILLSMVMTLFSSQLVVAHLNVFTSPPPDGEPPHAYISFGPGYEYLFSGGSSITNLNEWKG
ncbi:hypothetical protein [Bacillus horti]|uniref:Uncharacterized protein n=1 Tax=Caldalkalibacillus horti TaxID=77523 RepID=A0ABT9W446_9BACI|nr:hypothetical protein [Bacillus horti]MDQ0168021.1 hypothetical protein [Bacillus horti]